MDDAALTRKLIGAEEETRVLGLVRRGASAQAVAEHMRADGFSCEAGTVRKIVKRRLAELAEHDALTVEQLRAHENERLDDAVRKLYPLIEKADLKAVGLFLKLSERRAKLNGLDMPTRVAVEATDALAALGLNRELIERATAAFTSSYGPEDLIVDAEEVVDEAQAPAQPRQEARLPRALEERSQGGREAQPPTEALSGARDEVEAFAEIPADVQSLAQEGILEAQGGAYFQRARPRRRRDEDGPPQDDQPQATVVEP